VRCLGLQGSGLSVRFVVAACLSIGILAFCLLAVAPTPARAENDGPLQPTPRTAITIGGASVVLVATENKLYAFVDRLDDNAPVEDADLTIDTADGSAIELRRAPVTMNKATAGLFVGDFSRAGRTQDAFMVTLHSSVADGHAPAEITYTDATSATSPLPQQTLGSRLAIVVVSAGIGAVGAVMVMFWLRSGRRRVAARAPGRAHVTS